ncbi:MAG: FAD-dependent oxidoreductase [Nocardioidaceae bacterium]|nr:FAD-dependent oxidoreductase [Nocardioidaceae bacterium]
MVGLCVAWFLRREGIGVTVLDRRGVGAGASWGNAGWLAPALTLPLPEPAVLRTGLRAMLRPDSPLYVPPVPDPRLWRFLAEFTRHCTPERWRRALAVFELLNASALDAFDELDLARTVPAPAGARKADQFLAGFTSSRAREHLRGELVAVGVDPAQVQSLERDELVALEPSLGPGVTHGLRLHGQRYLDPGRYLAALADDVVAAGVKLDTGSEVVEVVRAGAGAEVLLDDGHRLPADLVVLANGSWLGDLARPHGVRRLVQAGRGYSFAVDPERLPAGPVYFPQQRLACTPLSTAGALRVAGMMEFRPADAPLDPRRIEAMVAAARPLLRGVSWERRREEWVGPRPCTVDGLPLVGRTRSPQVYVAGGHGMWGVTLGPLTGRLLAEQIVHRRTSDLGRLLDPLR